LKYELDAAWIIVYGYDSLITAKNTGVVTNKEKIWFFNMYRVKLGMHHRFLLSPTYGPIYSSGTRYLNQ
jgi:hypothetical protein